MKRKMFAFLLAAMAVSNTAQAEFMLTPLTSFGGGDGWLAPAEVIGSGASVLGTVNNQRGMSYFGPRNEVYVVDRTGGPFVRVLDGNTGETLRTLANNTPPAPTIISGGTFAVSMIATGSDGAIYVANLGTQTPVPPATATSNLRVYRWADSLPGTTPTLAFNALVTGANFTNPGARAGDTMAIIGGGSTARLAISGSGANGVALLDTADGGLTFSQNTSTIADAPSGAFRLGLDFVDANTVIGKQSGGGFNFVASDVAGTAVSTGATNISEAALAFYGPNSLLATIETGTSNLRLYTGSNPLGGSLGTLQFEGTTLGGTSGVFNNTLGALASNLNGTGDLSFGIDTNGTLRLYAMNSNQGIQAFTVSAVPEPSSIALVTLGVVGVVARRRQLAGRKLVS